MFTAQRITVEEVPLVGGDLFKDRHGVIWVAQYPGSEDEPASTANLVYHTSDATESREGDDVVELIDLPRPFTLLMRLGEVKR